MQTNLFRAQSGAHLSPDRQYRYALFRRWEPGPQFVVIGLNPSTADENIDDPTIRRCVGFAMREKCGALVMLNLFALRATDPLVMMQHPEPIGEENDEVIRRHALGQDHLVAAWGAYGGHRQRDYDVMRLVGRRLFCLGITRAGHPRHPLYLRNNTPLEPWTYRGPAGRSSYPPNAGDVR